jgi:predicted porin
MKKHLIAAAVAGVLAAPAMAQVTVYGILDNAVRSTNPDAGSTTTTLVSGSFLTSRLGFKGEEDLGGGMTAGFILEGKVNADDGSTTLGNRESSVYVKGGFGEIRMGRTDTSNSEGVELVAHFGNIGNFGLNHIGGVATGVEYAGDQANTIKYTSPSLGGLTVQIGQTFGDERTDGEDLNSISATYAAGPFAVAVGYDDVGDDNYQTIGARYNAGMVTVGAHVGKKDAATDVDVMGLSAKADLGGGMALHVGYKTSEEGTADKIKVTNLGLSKALSKRTTLLGMYQDNDNGSAAGSFFQAGIIHKF